MTKIETRPAEVKFARADLSAVEADGTFAGYASLFAKADLGRDMVMPGAFAASLRLDTGDRRLVHHHQRPQVPLLRLDRQRRLAARRPGTAIGAPPMPVFSPAMVSIPNPGTFWDIAQYLGIDGNMQWCFDAGDIASMPTASDQTWVNRGVSSPARNLTLGLDTAASTDDPAFHGSAGGLSASEYFAFDGGDFFRITSPSGSQPAWVQRIHKDNAIFAIGFWAYFATISASNGLVSTSAGNTGVTGFEAYVSSTAKLGLFVTNGSGSYALNVASTASVPTGKPVFLGIAVDEAAGTGFFQIDGAQESFTSTYTSPSSGNYGLPPLVGAGSSSTHRFQSGNRIYGFWMRETSGLTAAEMMALYKRSRMRPGF